MPHPDKLTLEEINETDISFFEWRDQPRPTSMSSEELIRDAFHVGYHRGRIDGREEFNDDPG